MKPWFAVSVALVVGCLTLWLARDVVRANRETTCKENLTTISLALHQYLDDYGAFPPEYTASRTGREFLSWRVLLLPYLGEEELYNKIRLDEPWDSPHNSALAKEMPAVFRCDASRTEPYYSNYVHLVKSDPDQGETLFNGSLPRRLRDITDGTSNTIILVETRRHAMPWMKPAGVPEDAMFEELQSSATPGTTNHTNFIQVLMADGAARKLNAEIERDLFHKLSTIDDSSHEVYCLEDFGAPVEPSGTEASPAATVPEFPAATP